MYSLTSRERTFTLIGLLVGLFLAALDQTIVATALPRILLDLHGLNLYVWVVTGYLLAATAMIPVYGKLSDLFGRKRVLLFGIAVFLAGSVLSGQARSMVELIAFRTLQGLGGAAIFSVTFTVVADLFAPAERGRYQGLFGAVFGMASVVGPWLGGLLTDNLSWRWVFYINLPLGLIAVLFIAFQMPSLRNPDAARSRVDWGGAILLLVGLVPLLLALSLGGVEYPWGSWQILVLFAGGAAGLAAFALVERRVSSPVLPYHFFRNRTYVTGILASAFIGGAAYFGAIVFLPAFMVLVTGASAGRAGLTITPLVLGVVTGSFVSGQIVSRIKRYKIVLLVAGGLALAGFVTLNTIDASVTSGGMIWRMIIVGLGIGPTLPLFTLAVQNAVPPSEMGAATSSAIFFRQIGAIVGLAVFSTLLTTTIAARFPAHLPEGMKVAGEAPSRSDFALLQSGDTSSLTAGIGSRMRALEKRVDAALASGDAAALNGLLAAPALNPRVKNELRRALGDVLVPGAPPTAAALAAARARVNGALETAAKKIEADVSRAFKYAFTDAIRKVLFWSLVCVIAGLAVVFFLPELELRTKANIEAVKTPAKNGAPPREAETTDPPASAESKEKKHGHS